jgi:hypothetical protein
MDPFTLTALRRDMEELARRAARLERILRRAADVLGNRFGVSVEDELAAKVRELLARGQPDVAVVEYRKATGAGLDEAMADVQDWENTLLEKRWDLILGKVEQEGR